MHFWIYFLSLIWSFLLSTYSQHLLKSDIIKSRSSSPSFIILRRYRRSSLGISMLRKLIRLQVYKIYRIFCYDNCLGWVIACLPLILLLKIIINCYYNETIYLKQILKYKFIILASITWSVFSIFAFSSFNSRILSALPLCGIISLPFRMLAFWSPKQYWMMSFFAIMLLRYFIWWWIWVDFFSSFFFLILLTLHTNSDIFYLIPHYAHIFWDQTYSSNRRMRYYSTYPNSIPDSRVKLFFLISTLYLFFRVLIFCSHSSTSPDLTVFIPFSFCAIHIII